MVLVYTQGAYLHWRTISWISLVYCLLPLVLMFFWSVESPIWLVSKGKTDRALEAFQFLLRKDKVSKSLNLSQDYKLVLLVEVGIVVSISHAYLVQLIIGLNMGRCLHCFLFLQSCPLSYLLPPISYISFITVFTNSIHILNIFL